MGMGGRYDLFLPLPFREGRLPSESRRRPHMHLLGAIVLVSFLVNNAEP